MAAVTTISLKRAIVLKLNRGGFNRGNFYDAKVSALRGDVVLSGDDRVVLNVRAAFVGSKEDGFFVGVGTMHALDFDALDKLAYIDRFTGTVVTVPRNNIDATAIEESD